MTAATSPSAAPTPDRGGRLASLPLRAKILGPVVLLAALRLDRHRRVPRTALGRFRQHGDAAPGVLHRVVERHAREPVGLQRHARPGPVLRAHHVRAVLLAHVALDTEHVGDTTHRLLREHAVRVVRPRGTGRALRRQPVLVEHGPAGEPGEPDVRSDARRPAERLQHALGGGCDGCVVGEVAAERHRLVAEWTGHRVELVAGARDERDAHVLREQQLRDGEADAAGRAGDRAQQYALAHELGR